MIFTNLETDKIYLKNIGLEDRDFLYNLFSPGNDEVNKFHPDDAPYNCISEADEEIKEYIEPEPRERHQWVIIRKADNVKMGLCGFHDWDRNIVL